MQNWGNIDKNLLLLHLLCCYFFLLELSLWLVVGATAYTKKWGNYKYKLKGFRVCIIIIFVNIYIFLRHCSFEPPSLCAVPTLMFPWKVRDQMCSVQSVSLCATKVSLHGLFSGPCIACMHALYASNFSNVKTSLGVIKKKKTKGKYCPREKWAKLAMSYRSKHYKYSSKESVRNL